MEYLPTELSVAFDWLDRFITEGTRLGLDTHQPYLSTLPSARPNRMETSWVTEWLSATTEVGKAVTAAAEVAKLNQASSATETETVDRQL